MMKKIKQSKIIINLLLCIGIIYVACYIIYITREDNLHVFIDLRNLQNLIPSLNLNLPRYNQIVDIFVRLFISMYCLAFSIAFLNILANYNIKLTTKIIKLVSKIIEIFKYISTFLLYLLPTLHYQLNIYASQAKITEIFVTKNLYCIITKIWTKSELKEVYERILSQKKFDYFRDQFDFEEIYNKLVKSDKNPEMLEFEMNDLLDEFEEEMGYFEYLHKIFLEWQNDFFTVENFNNMNNAVIKAFYEYFTPENVVLGVMYIGVVAISVILLKQLSSDILNSPMFSAENIEWVNENAAWVIKKIGNFFGYNIIPRHHLENKFIDLMCKHMETVSRARRELAPMDIFLCEQKCWSCYLSVSEFNFYIRYLRYIDSIIAGKDFSYLKDPVYHLMRSVHWQACLKYFGDTMHNDPRIIFDLLMPT